MRSEYGPPDVLRLEEVAIPVPKADEVLVRMSASSVNMADVDYLLGRPKFARLGTGLRVPKNRGLGLDVAGVVEAIGENVTRFRPGDEVFGDLTEHGFGAFAEYVCAPEDAFAPKPKGLTFEAAAAAPQAGVLALQGLRGKRPVRPGQRVLINGAGGNIGPFAVQIAKSFGAEVTGVDGTEKLDLLRSVGADHVIDYTEVDYTATGQQYDRILDVAASRPIRESRRALRPKGVYVAVPGSITGVFQSRGCWTADLDGGQSQDGHARVEAVQSAGRGVPDAAARVGRRCTGHRPHLPAERGPRSPRVSKRGSCPREGCHHRG